MCNIVQNGYRVIHFITSELNCCCLLWSFIVIFCLCIKFKSQVLTIIELIKSNFFHQDKYCQSVEFCGFVDTRAGHCMQVNDAQEATVIYQRVSQKYTRASHTKTNDIQQAIYKNQNKWMKQLNKETCYKLFHII